jgi:hypothetical protein
MKEEIGLKQARVLADAIETKAKNILAESGYPETPGLLNSAKVGIYEVLLSYLTKEQMDKIVKTHNLEI